MFDPELPFNPESINRLIAVERGPEPEVLAFTKLGCWGLAHLSSTLSIDGRPRLVGRELESVRLLHAIDTVARENAAVVATISGMPGSGKSRLIEDTLNVAEVAGFDGRIFSVAAQAGDTSNATIARLLCARFGLNQKSAALKRDCLLRRVSELFEDERVEDVCYFLGGLVGVKFEQTPLTRALSQQSFQAELALQTLVCELFAADTERAPLCLVIEDLHYVDRDSLGTLMAMTDDLRPGGLVICSAHPDFFNRNEHFAEMGSAVHEHVELPALSSDEVRALLRQLVGPCHHGDQELEQHVQQVALGNPGLIHELVRELWAYGALQSPSHEDGCEFHAERVPDPASSPRLKAANDLRMNSLPSLQLAVLETGAVVGSACWQGLWPALLRTAQLGDLEPIALSGALRALEGSGHLLRMPDSRIAGEVELVFKEPSERSRLLEQVGPSRRRLLHRVIADWLAAHADAVAGCSELSALLAKHLNESGSSYRAALAYFDAARLARAQDGCLQASTYFAQGLEALGEHDNRRRVDALHDYGAVLVELGRPSQARQAFAEMLELAERLGLPNKRGAALNRIGRVHRESGELALAQEAFERAFEAFEQASDVRGVTATKDDLGKLLWLKGDRARALPLLRSALETRKRAGDERSLAVSLANLAMVWSEQGRSATSERALGIANDIFERSADAGGRVDSRLALGRVATHRHELERARALFRSATELAFTAKDRPRLARCLIALGVAELRCQNVARAEELLERGSQLAESIGSWLELAEAKRALAKLALKRRQLPEARREIYVALRLARRVQCRAQLAATLRTFAEIVAETRRAPDDTRVVGYYLRSIDLAKRLGNEFELAKGYRALARFADRYENPEIKQQSHILRELSDEIFMRYESRPAA
jgi:tetratricopeptide (TPR) repeat protein